MCDGPCVANDGVQTGNLREESTRSGQMQKEMERCPGQDGMVVPPSPHSRENCSTCSPDP